MEYLSLIAECIGWLVMLFFVVFSAIIPLSYHNSDEVFWITYFDVGILIAKSEKMIDRLSKLRGSKRQRVYINAPSWFNRHIYNFGIRNPETVEDIPYKV